MKDLDDGYAQLNEGSPADLNILENPIILKNELAQKALASEGYPNINESGRWWEVQFFGHFKKGSKLKPTFKTDLSEGEEALLTEIIHNHKSIYKGWNPRAPRTLIAKSLLEAVNSYLPECLKIEAELYCSLHSDLDFQCKCDGFFTIRGHELECVVMFDLTLNDSKRGVWHQDDDLPKEVMIIHRTDLIQHFQAVASRIAEVLQRKYSPIATRKIRRENWESEKERKEEIRQERKKARAALGLPKPDPRKSPYEMRKKRLRSKKKLVSFLVRKRGKFK